MNHVVVVGAGVGGLTTAAVLARRGVNVTVLEAHVYPGGCAGTFFHQGYRFDAGATLAGGFYPGGPMDLVAKRAGLRWDFQPDDLAMAVILPDGRRIDRPTDSAPWQQERLRHFGPAAERFWRWQEATADALWALALRLPPWPPQTSTIPALLADGLAWLRDVRPPGPRLAGIVADLRRPVASRLPAGEALRQYVDGQLLIAAQTTAARANALFGASALDLPRRGIVHTPGGMGGIATQLVNAIRAHGGQVLFRQHVTRVRRTADGFRVETARGLDLHSSRVVFNLPDVNVAALLSGDQPGLDSVPPDGWGAFMVYAGVDERVIPSAGPLHYQVITGEPLAEGRSVFISISPAWDRTRAPAGRRALTFSTHTELAPWWSLFHHDRSAYEERKQAMARTLLAAAERVLPGLRSAATLVLPGTPVTFQRFTGRDRGWVGGYPQTSLFRQRQPALAPGLWRVGDSIFPGQSTAAVALGGVRVAEALLAKARG